MGPGTPPLNLRLILASTSPRRRQLMQGLDLPLQIVSIDVDETPPPGLPDDAVAEHLARKKAEAWTGTLAPDQVLASRPSTSNTSAGDAGCGTSRTCSAAAITV